jgi:transposase-like protein
VEAAVEETLTYYAFPEEHWRRILQTNILNASTSREIDAAFATFVRERPDTATRRRTKSAASSGSRSIR